MSHAWQPVTCEECGRKYICTPHDDYYTTPDGRGLCERCLVGDLPIRTAESPIVEWPSITCPVCGMTSHHPKDIAEGYCGNCHDWTTTRTIG